MRGIFSAGVLDRFLEKGFQPFDLCMGVSAGAGNVAGFMAEMPKRSFKIYLHWSLSPEFISLASFMKGGHFMDLDWMWDETIAHIRLNLDRIYAGGRPLVVCLTDVKTGKPLYKFTRKDNLEHILKASSAIPVAYRGFPVVDGRPCTDGGIADPIPVEQAMALGGMKIMVVRSRPKAYRKKERLLQHGLKLALRNYPALAEATVMRADKYNRTVDLMAHPGGGVSVIQVCPPQGFAPGRFCRNRNRLIQGYLSGRHAAEKAIGQWNGDND